MSSRARTDISRMSLEEAKELSRRLEQNIAVLQEDLAHWEAKRDSAQEQVEEVTSALRELGVVTTGASDTAREAAKLVAIRRGVSIWELGMAVVAGAGDGGISSKDVADALLLAGYKSESEQFGKVVYQKLAEARDNQGYLEFCRRMWCITDKGREYLEKQNAS